jgi:hypothetical protein
MAADDASCVATREVNNVRSSSKQKSSTVKQTNKQTNSVAIIMQANYAYQATAAAD